MGAIDRGQEQPLLQVTVTIGCCMTNTATPPAWQIPGPGGSPQDEPATGQEDGYNHGRWLQTSEIAPEPPVELPTIQGAPSHQAQRSSRMHGRVFSKRCVLQLPCWTLQNLPPKHWKSANSDNKAQHGRAGGRVEEQASGVAWPRTHIEMPSLNKERVSLRCQVSGSKLFEMLWNHFWEVELR